MMLIVYIIAASIIIMSKELIIMQVLATIYHIVCGRLDGKVYTNGWPEFSTVVCQYKGGFSQWVCHEVYQYHDFIQDLPLLAIAKKKKKMYHYYN